MIDQAALFEILATARDYSIIALAVLVAGMGGVLVAMLAPLLKGLRRLRRHMPWYMHRLQTASATGRRSVQGAAQVVSAPFVWLQRASGQVHQLNERVKTVLDGALQKGR